MGKSLNFRGGDIPKGVSRDLAREGQIPGGGGRNPCDTGCQSDPDYLTRGEAKVVRVVTIKCNEQKRAKPNRKSFLTLSNKTDC